MKICGFRVSNYYNKVRLVLLEKEIPHEEDPTCFPSQKPEFLARSPMGKVPFLETEHGILVESGVICEYLEDVFPQKPLLPKDPYARAKLRELIAILELHVELVNRRTFPALFFGGHLSEDEKKVIRTELDKGVRALSHVLQFSPFAGSGEFSLADCAAAIHLPMISTSSRMAFGEDALGAIPGMKEYLEMIAKRPHVARIYAERDQAFQVMMARRAT